MRRFIIILLFCVGSAIVLYGQKRSDDHILSKDKAINPASTNSRIEKEHNNSKSYSFTTSKDIQSLSNYYSKNFRLQGYRVQIGTTDSKKAANKMISKFISEHGSYNTYETYQAPTFKVRVGDFISYTEAYGLRRKVKKEFQSSFVVEVKEIDFSIPKE